MVALGQAEAVVVDDAVLVPVLQRLAHMLGDRHRLLQRQPVTFGLPQQPFRVVPAQVLNDDEGPALLLTHVDHTDHVGVVAQAAHKPG